MTYLTKSSRLTPFICFFIVSAFFTGFSFAEEDAAKNPLRFWEGQNKSYLQATIKADLAYFSQSNSWFGEAKANLGESSDDWWESVVRPGIEGSYFFDQAGEIYGRFDAVQASTQNTDAAASNNGQGNNSKIRVEESYLGWRSGNLFNSLDKDFLDISFGRQQYIAGNGFLFYTQSSNGDRRGGFWLGERHAAEYMGIVRLRQGSFAADAVYFKADDAPDTDTKLGGATLDYTFYKTTYKMEPIPRDQSQRGPRIGIGQIHFDRIKEKVAGIGGGAYYVDSDLDTRDQMMVYNIRADIQPFAAFDVLPALKGFHLEGEYVYQDTDDNDIGNGSGWYVQPSYQFDIPWKPSLTYRYASFDDDYDPLFYGFYDWGYWFQGEILGNYVLTNSNLNSHLVKLNVKPVDSLSINLFYYNFRLDDADSFGVDDKEYADEIDFIVDYTYNDHLSFSAVGAWATPDDAAKQSTGGNDDWYYGMLYTSISF
jgi:hypothetical protein